MNYFAHGIRFLDRPYFLAGTATPDWLSACDRKVKLRKSQVPTSIAELPSEMLQQASSDQQRSEFDQFLNGIHQHLDDDVWFHGTRTFSECNVELAVAFRKALKPDRNYRCHALGHIAIEMLIDRYLMELHPEQLDRYYQSLSGVNELVIQSLVNSVATRTTERLVTYLRCFRWSQFLKEYQHPVGIIMKLNGVMRRVKLPELPFDITEVIEQGYELVKQRWGTLVPLELQELSFANVPKSSDVSSTTTMDS